MSMLGGEYREPVKKESKISRPKEVKQAPTKKTNQVQFWRKKK